MGQPPKARGIILCQVLKWWKFSSLTTWLGKFSSLTTWLGFLPIQLVKEENFHHFMSAGATEKSLQCYLYVVFVGALDLMDEIGAAVAIPHSPQVWEEVHRVHHGRPRSRSRSLSRSAIDEVRVSFPEKVWKNRYYFTCTCSRGKSNRLCH